jgi:phenylalanyl-tRNA synthetase beta chain
VPLRPSRVETLLGITLTEDEISALLLPLGFKVACRGEDELIFDVPGFRSYDTLREVDLLEEIARTYGYDRFPSDLGPFRPGTVLDHPLFQVEDELRDLLVGEGFLEAQTMAFGPPEEGSVQVKNPVSMQEDHLRADLLPGLLRRVEYNFARGIRDVRLFELGTVFANSVDGGAPKEETHLCVVLSGDQRPGHWSGKAGEADLWYLKGLLTRLVPGARIQGAELKDGGPEGKGTVPAEGFTLIGPEGESLGFAGRVDPKRVDAPAWAGSVWGLEIALPSEPGPKPVPVFRPPPAYPGVDRDLALLLPNHLSVREVEELIRSCAGPLLVDLAVFDLYEGKGIPDGHRSVAFRFRYQSEERTLTDGDVDESVGAVTHRLREELGVEPRA